MALSAVVLFGIAAWVIDGSALYHTRRSLQNAADAAALASVVELPSVASTQAIAEQYAQDNHQGHGTILHPPDIETGNWDAGTESFSPGGSPLNAVRVTTRRDEAHGNPVDYVFAPVIGRDAGDVSATAVAVVTAGEGDGGVRFFIDEEMIDKDVKDSADDLPIEDLADCTGSDPEDVISDLDGDWFVDIYDHMAACGSGFQIELPTGQGTSPGSNDAGLHEIDAGVFPFGANSSPCPSSPFVPPPTPPIPPGDSLQNFLNFNEDGSWREDQLGPNWPDLLDPLVGVNPVWDEDDYAAFVNPNVVLVSPIYKSDVSNLGGGEVNAKGERRGLMAFKIVALGPNPPGSDLPFLTIELVDPATVDTCALVSGEPGGGGGGAVQLVR